MTWLAWLEFAISILNGVAGAVGNSGLTKVAAEIQAAADRLAAVVDSDVTRAQLEGMRYTPKW